MQSRLLLINDPSYFRAHQCCMNASFIWGMTAWYLSHGNITAYYSACFVCAIIKFPLLLSDLQYTLPIGIDLIFSITWNKSHLRPVWAVCKSWYLPPAQKLSKSIKFQHLWFTPVEGVEFDDLHHQALVLLTNRACACTLGLEF